MVKEVMTLIDLSQWSQLSLLIFAGVFIAVSIRTLLQSNAMTRENACLVLDDETRPES